MTPDQLRGRRILTRLAVAAMLLSIVSYGLLAVAGRSVGLLFFAVQDLGTILLVAATGYTGAQSLRWFLVLWLVIKTWVKFLVFLHPERLGPAGVEPSFVLALQIVGVLTVFTWLLLALALAFSPSVSGFLWFRRKQTVRLRLLS